MKTRSKELAELHGAIDRYLQAVLIDDIDNTDHEPDVDDIRIVSALSTIVLSPINQAVLSATDKEPEGVLN